MITGRKGRKIIGSDGKIAAYLDEHSVVLNGEVYQCTIRTGQCPILSNGSKCQTCTSYRDTLRAIYHRYEVKAKQSPSRHTSTSSCTNIRFLDTPQRMARYRKLKARASAAEKSVKRLQDRITELMDAGGVEVDPDLHGNLEELMESHDNDVMRDFPENSFQRLFWSQQLAAVRSKDRRQVRWHPMIIRWCLHLKMISSASYHALRTSGFITLPSERTLRDYTHLVKGTIGIQSEVSAQLIKEARVASLEEWQKFVVVAFDEVKIKEDLVFDKNSCEIVGFVDLGEVTNQLSSLADITANSTAFDPNSVATHVLLFMVRGIFTDLQFPYAQYATKTAAGAELFTIAWDVIRNVESCDLKVIALSCDGASPNRKFFRMHRKTPAHSGVPVYKTTNPYSPDKRDLYFISDVPHLMKTTRNCWSHSFAHGDHRHLWVKGKHISWQHLRTLYTKARTDTGLTLLKKLKWEHLRLTSYSRMRVYLAVQVLSSSVANGFAYFGNEETSETQRFVEKFDAFFDCMNVRSFTECFEKRKPNLRPYRSPEDSRLKWLKEDFLGYLQEWQQSVDERVGFTPAEKQTMCLSKETLEGLKITVHAFVEMAKYLLQQPGVKYLFSERFCQDPVEAFFGKQRACGGRSDNPTVKQFLENTVSLRVQASAALDPVRGNCRKRRRVQQVIDHTPLPKRKRRTTPSPKRKERNLKQRQGSTARLN